MVLAAPIQLRQRRRIKLLIASCSLVFLIITLLQRPDLWHPSSSTLAHTRGGVGAPPIPQFAEFMRDRSQHNQHPTINNQKIVSKQHDQKVPPDRDSRINNLPGNPTRPLALVAISKDEPTEKEKPPQVGRDVDPGTWKAEHELQDLPDAGPHSPDRDPRVEEESDEPETEKEMDSSSVSMNKKTEKRVDEKNHSKPSSPPANAAPKPPTNSPSESEEDDDIDESITAEELIKNEVKQRLLNVREEDLVWLQGDDEEFANELKERFEAVMQENKRKKNDVAVMRKKRRNDKRKAKLEKERALKEKMQEHREKNLQ
ncbi:hypothetical protein HDU98_007112 [Podochytrium sp. JEL0797]|nr:hypothetical protein HDU98_007112 [Podochytrium sp. JEL0797]